MENIVTLNLAASSTHQLCIGASALPNLPTARSFLLLLYFTQHKGQALGRDVAAEALWPDVKIDTARTRLRSELWRLKQWFDLHCFNLSPFLACDRKHLIVAANFPVQSDTEALHHIADTLYRNALEVNLKDIRQDIYRLLDRFEHGVLSSYFNEWAETEKFHVQNSLRQCREFLFHQLCQKGEWREAIIHGQALIEKEPLDEYLHAELMRCYIALECRGLAVRQYSECQKVLREELGITPSTSIERLYRSLLSHKHLPGFIASQSTAGFSKPTLSA
ncbi:BTAD domain-containing putative transcriptional regulator [Simiduia curdlanivorans]|uniref:BTAD domain-containing putative transcriptional regulator n=1 Tax=Simiduia curdlanivorans TaxID=1492769 RepID=A0ABV8V8A4_9GAMM|nr:BTAD domain-containing putative transcriptional regulator [Simiduia curdlanivorans]MDN3638813.1 BTAD domain-containing putative transcriptional regulator [Simiduia curdlanivorans]